MSDRLCLIVNPISGTRSDSAKQSLVGQIVDRLGTIGYEINTEYTGGAGEATRIARRAIKSGYNGVLVLGGDGTINETAQAMIDAPIPMGIIPSGSGNGLARHMSIPMDPIEALNIIAAKNIVNCDFGTVNSHAFFCTFGVGFDAAVSDRFATAKKRGKFTYIRSAIEEFSRYKTDHYILNLDGHHIELDAFLIAVCNASQYGNNAYIAPNASITDGLLDVIIVKRSSRLRTLLLGFDLMTGLIAQNDVIETYRVKHVHITRCNPCAAHIDGEPMSIGADIDIHCHPQRLKLFASPTKTPFKPIITPAQALFSDLSATFTEIFR